MVTLLKPKKLRTYNISLGMNHCSMHWSMA